MPPVLCWSTSPGPVYSQTEDISFSVASVIAMSSRFGGGVFYNITFVTLIHFDTNKYTFIVYKYVVPFTFKALM